MSNPQKIPAEDPLRRLLENAPVDDEEVTEEDLAAIQEGIEEHTKGETLYQEEVECLFLRAMTPPEEFVLFVESLHQKNRSANPRVVAREINRAVREVRAQRRLASTAK